MQMQYFRRVMMECMFKTRSNYCQI